MLLLCMISVVSSVPSHIPHAHAVTIEVRLCCRGVCKRKLDALQMELGMAFASQYAAFEALAKDVGWTRVAARRPASTSALGLFIEARSAVWIPRSNLETARAQVPRLAPLKGIHATFGLRWTPGQAAVTTARFLCLCAACVVPDGGGQTCRFPGLTQQSDHTFRVLPPRTGVKVITIARLKAFLAIRGPALPRSGRRAVLIARAAGLLTWDDGEREACVTDDALALAVTNKVTEFEAACERAQTEAEARAREAQAQQEAAEKVVADAVKKIALLRRSGGASAPAAIAALQQQVVTVHLANLVRAGAEDKQEPDEGAEGKQQEGKQREGKQQEGKQAEGKQAEGKVTCEEAANSEISALQTDDRLSVFFQDAGWCSGFVSRLTNSFVYVLWDCAEADCPANRAPTVRSEDVKWMCTHDGGGDGREETKLKKTTLVRDLMLGEVKLSDDQ